MGYTIKPPPGTPGKAWPAIVVGCFVAFGGLLFGYDTGTIGGILGMPYFRENFSTGYINRKDGLPDFSSGQKSLIVSILSAGTFVGALSGAPMADFFGRRMALMLSCIVFSFGVALQTAAVELDLFNAGRFFAGAGVGLISALVPLYQSETAPKWIRGSIVGAYQLSITIGLMLAAIVNNSTHDHNNRGSYRIPVAIQFAWAAILAGGMVLLPETPRMHVKRGHNDLAAQSLGKLRRLPVDDPAVQEELEEIIANHEYEQSLGNATYLDCFRGNLGKRLFTGCGLQALQQLTGINFIFYYGTTFFQNSGISQPFTISMITSGVNVGSTIPGLYLLETLGRRKLLFYGAIWMTVCQYLVAIIGTKYTSSEQQAAQKALVAFVCLYISGFAASWGPTAWVVCGEIYPLKVRAKSLSMTTASNWLFNWAIAYATPYMVDDGPGNANLQAKVFFIWATACLFCITFVYTMIYETKGLALEQVDELYLKVDKAWNSAGFVPTVSFQEVRSTSVDGRKASLLELEAEALRKRSLATEQRVSDPEKTSV